MVMSASISLWLRRPPARVRPPSSRLIHILGNAVCSLRWRSHYNLPGAINRRSGPRLTRQEFSFADHSRPTPLSSQPFLWQITVHRSQISVRPIAFANKVRIGALKAHSQGRSGAPTDRLDFRHVEKLSRRAVRAGGIEDQFAAETYHSRN